MTDVLCNVIAAYKVDNKGKKSVHGDIKKGGAMTDFKPLPTENESFGFWGTSVVNGYDAPTAWDAASRVLAEALKLTPEETRDLLDARFGRHLSDDLSFIKGGPVDFETVERHIMGRLADRKWRKWFETAVREAKAAMNEGARLS